jgi:uncharacterized protein DUF4325
MRNNVTRENNVITIEGELYDFHRLLSLVHAAIEKASYSEVVLNMENLTRPYQNTMLSLCAQVMAYRNADINFILLPPKDKRLSNLFNNTNWGFLLDPHKFDESQFRGYTKIPATQYQKPADQQKAVNKIVNVILGAIPDMHRNDFAAFEWSINELTDNVLIHSESTIGGLVQVSTFKEKKQLQFVIADAGVGIPKTLREGHPDIGSDTDALDKAIREGVTRDITIGQGNGLFGSYQICSHCKGFFSIDSGHARLSYTENKGLSIINERIPFDGTLITATIDFSKPKLLEEALKFKGNKYTPVDYIEIEYEKNKDGKLSFNLEEECQSFGSRVAGKPIRIKLSNLLKMQTGDKIYIDLANIPIVSSSFADEVFGKLFLEAGAIAFMQKFELINATDTVKHLIDKAISQRMKTGVLD